MNDNKQTQVPSEIKPIANGAEYVPNPAPTNLQETSSVKPRKNSIQLFLKFLLIISPGVAAFLFSYLSNYTSSNPGNMAIGVWLSMIFVLGIPFVAITGLIFGALVRNNPRAEVISIYGYLAPAIITWLLASTVLFS